MRIRQMSTKIVAVLVTMAMVLTIVPFSAMGVFAAIGAQFQIGSATAIPEETVELIAELKNAPAVKSMAISNIDYDINKIRLINVEWLCDAEIKNWNSTQGRGVLTFGENTDANGAVLKMTFQINNVVADSKVDVSCSVILKTMDANGDEVPIAVTVVSGHVEICNETRGDMDGNKKLNSEDAVYLLYHTLFGKEEYPIKQNGDLDGNGKTDSNDAVYLLYHVLFGEEDYPLHKKCTHMMNHIPATAATCDMDGNIQYWYCSSCEKCFADESGTKEIAQEKTIIAATGHTYSKQWSYDQTYHWHPAACDHSDLVSERGEHVFGSDKLCSVCGISNAPDPSKPYMITYKLVEYNKQNGDVYLETLNIDNSQNRTWFSATESFDLADPSCGKAYTFNGWYTEDGNKVTKISAGTREDITLYARWTEKTFKITYDVYQTPVGEIKDDRYLSYKPSEGLSTLPNPEIYNYVFLGWYTDDGVEMKNIPVGTTDDITLNPHLTSKRNLTKAVSSLDDPIIIEDSDDGVIYFTYEIGTIENVPLSDPIWTIQSVAGLAQQKSETVTTAISEEQASQIANTISKATVDSATWTLSKDWNDVTSVTEEWAKQHGMDVEIANELTKTESGTYSFTSDNGGCKTTTETDGTTTLEYNSENYTHGNSAEFNAKINAQYTSELHAGVKLEGVAEVGGSKKFEIGGEIGGGYEQHKETNEHTGTDTTRVDTTVKSGSTSWNNSETTSETKEASQKESVREALSEIISNTKGYGKSYSSGGENSEAKEFSSTDSESVNSSSSLTYFSSQTKTTTTTYSTDGKSEGYYRLVVAGTVHVFGVVGYDVATQSYFTYTFNVLDDKTDEFLDYSPKRSFDDYQNGVIPFEVPYFVHEYVASKTAVTESLAYITDSTTGTAIVTNFGENTGTKEEPNWVYPTLDVVIPSYIASGGNAYKVTGMTANAFAGKPIRSVILSDYITDLPENAFKDCIALEQISGRFTTIGDNAFSGCESLEDFTISPRTTAVGADAFRGVTTLKMSALHQEFAPVNAAEATQTVIQGAINSGAKNVIVDISKISKNIVLTLNVPAIDGFELSGDKKTTYTDLKVVSQAKMNKLHNLTVVDCTRVPLEIKEGDLILDTVNVMSPSFVLLLAKDGATVSLLRDSKLTAQSGNAVVAKNPQIESVKDDDVWGSLRVTGNFYYCGTKPDTDYMTIDNGELISLNNEEFDSYIQGCFKIKFDPNGGTVDLTEMTAFVGQKLESLPTPSKTGYTFIGWFDGNGAQITDTSVLTTVQDITLTARWSAKGYEAHWNTGSGYTITVNRTSSPYAGAATGKLDRGAAVYYGDVLSITYSANTGYSLVSKGKTAITVVGNVTASDIYASASVNRYTVSWETGTGYSIVVKRTSSPNQGAATGALNNGEPVYYGDVLSVTYSANTGYSLGNKGKTSITVTGNITKEHIYASANANEYTYNIIYVSSNGTDLGSSSAKYKYGTTNTITPPAKSGYNTPAAQTVKWDSTSAKTITFKYIPTSVPTSQSTASGWWWKSNGAGNGITYSVQTEYRNRKANSVEIRIVWTQTIKNSAFGYNQYFWCSFWHYGERRGTTGNVKIASTSTWPFVSNSGPWHSGSVVASSGWITVPLETTGATVVGVACDWWTEVNGTSGSWENSNIAIPAY